ncbi:MFS transporter [Cryptosporangium aurantiacum]|uniref:Predicted arabinose efflux permease, MFS family n=1 Tax=Cryptosporangium aurantiacum TaxID=134849 RepID=A0A1M7RJH2_9ACTN|nr:MFS transporter [Cryptosporangium aurantiacum]SHN46495.1 Predicted arabinose efflux permease, MFS family [Cryptosporangium aurantiacum]
MPAAVAAPRARLPGVAWRLSAVSFLAASADSFFLLLLLWVAGPQGWTGLQTALVILALRLPTLAAGVLLGRAVDRWGARRLMLIDLAGRAALLGGLALTGRLPLIAVLLVGAATGCLAPASYAGARWLLPRVVPDDALGRANAVVAFGDHAPLVLGPALVGPALALFGTSVSLLVPIGLLVAALVLARGLPAVASPAAPEAVRDAPHAGRLPGRVTALIALSTAYYFVYGPFESATPALVRARLDSGEAIYSLLWVVFGLGAIATLPLVPRLGRRRPGLVNALGALFWGLVMLPVLVVQDVPLAAGLFLLGGAVWGPYASIETAALQRWVPPSQHGRVFGLQRSLLGTASPLGAAIGAVALEQVSAQAVLGCSALLCALAGLLALARRDLRRAE